MKILEKDCSICGREIWAALTGACDLNIGLLMSFSSPTRPLRENIAFINIPFSVLRLIVGVWPNLKN